MKPKLAKGTRDFNAIALNKRRKVTETIQKHFQLFGFTPLETPSFENLQTLTGKYGEEGDRLIFKILNSGLNEKKNKEDLLKEFNTTLEKPYTTEKLTDKALRYDLTVPFARYVAMNHGQLTFPYKRYQIQPVWRADRPQKGRFREFFQCDADVVGSYSLQYDIECISLYDSVFSDLEINVDIHINNRKILAGIAEYAQIPNQLIDFTVALDKLDKIGKEKVIEELQHKQISSEAILKLEPLLSPETNFEAQIKLLENLLQNSEIGKQGIAEIKEVYQTATQIGLQKSQLILDITLARGLDYYTGSIFEVKAQNVAMGSIGGGGRYDNLTEVFGVKDKPGIGISFGLDRIILVMEELNLFENLATITTQILLLNLSEEDKIASMQMVQKLRKLNISAELYPETAKMKKQFSYAEKKNIPFVAFYGEKERNNNTITLKNINTGEQSDVKVDEVEGFF